MKQLYQDHEAVGIVWKTPRKIEKEDLVALAGGLAFVGCVIGLVWLSRREHNG